MRKNQLFYFILFLVVAQAFFWFLAPVSKAVQAYVSVNYNNSETKSRKVQLNFQGLEGTRMMMISNSVDFVGANWEPYQTQKNWYLDYGVGAKTVYVKFRDNLYNVSSIYSDTIRLTVPVNMDVSFTIDGGAKETNSRYVSLKFSYSNGVEGFIVSNDNNFVGVEYTNMVDSLTWVLTPGDGVKTIYVQFIDANKKAVTINKTITYHQVGVNIPEGSLVKGQTNTVYYFGYDGEIHPFLNSLIYHSWYKDFSNIKYVSNSKLSQYKLGKPVCVRPGTWLVKFKGLPRTYAVGPGCQLFPLLSNAQAAVIYGKTWQKRVIELDTIVQDSYDTITYDASNLDIKIVDQDRDGVNSDVEEEYGTSDNNIDSDNDDLTDYEEIYYWFTDPIVADTDNDGFKDGPEIVNGFSPTGNGKLTEITNNSYEYPPGSIIKSKKDGKLYYHNSNGKYYYVGKNSDDSLFKSNNLSALFIVDSPYTLNFNAERGSINKNEMEIIYPTQFVGKVLYKM